MRLSCIYKCKVLPVCYRMMFVSLIKKALESSNEEYFNKLYYYKDKLNKKSKNFCFSVYLNEYEIKDEHFEINGNIQFNISSSDKEFIINLYNGLLRNPVFEYKNYKLERQKVRTVKEKSITSNIALFKTLSPIYIKDEEGNALELHDGKYEENLNYIIDLTLKNFRGYGLKKKIMFKPIVMKKVVVKEKLIDDKDYLYLKAFKGVFCLGGDVEDLNHIYELGLGFRRSQGFGMVELLQ